MPFSSKQQAFLNIAQVKGHEIDLSMPRLEIDKGEDQQAGSLFKENENKLNKLFNNNQSYNGLYISCAVINQRS